MEYNIFDNKKTYFLWVIKGYYNVYFNFSYSNIILNFYEKKNQGHKKAGYKMFFILKLEYYFV